jgi:hypothetical protein
MLIDVECQRISDVRNALQHEEKDLRLFTASISLARFFQAQYHSRNNQAIAQMGLSFVDSKEVMKKKHINCKWK